METKADRSNALWVGFKAGSNAVNHSHLDLGTFTLDADGVRWAVDLGRDDYNLPGYWERDSVESRRWQYRRLNNLGHNTVTPGSRLQEPRADAPILRFSSTNDRAFAVADLTSAYPGAVARMQRGLAMLDRKRVLLQDDVTGLARDSPLTWRTLTFTYVTINSPQRATLTKANRSLRVEILSPAAAQFTTGPATPTTRIENQNVGVTVLEAIVPAAESKRDVRVAVLILPLGEK